MATPTFLAKTQFVGFIKLDFSNYPNFNEFAYQVEQKYLMDLLGYEQMVLFLANYAGVAKYRYLDVGIDGGWEDDNGTMQRLMGIRAMLPYFFYYEYVVTGEDPRTLSGDPQESYLKAVNGAKYIKNKQIVNAYNTGVDLYNELIAYMTKIEGDTPDTYENWSYKTKEKINTFGI